MKNSKPKDSKVAMTIRVGTVWAAALNIMAEKRGQTVEELIEDLIRDAALDFTAQQHKGKLMRVVDHTSDK